MIVSINALHRHEIVDSVADNSSKDSVFAIEMLAFPKGYKELRAICIFTAICHGNQPSPSEFESLVDLIFKRLSIDGLTSSASPCWVSTLDHESRDHSMEDAIVIVLIHAVL